MNEDRLNAVKCVMAKYPECNVKTFMEAKTYYKECITDWVSKNTGRDAELLEGWGNHGST